MEDGDRSASDGCCGRLTDGRGRWPLVGDVLTERRWAVAAGLRCGLCGVAVVVAGVVVIVVVGDGVGAALEREERLTVSRLDEADGADGTWADVAVCASRSWSLNDPTEEPLEPLRDCARNERFMSSLPNIAQKTQHALTHCTNKETVVLSPQHREWERGGCHAHCELVRDTKAEERTTMVSRGGSSEAR